MNHPIGDDDISLAEIGPWLFGELAEDGVPYDPIGRQVLGLRRAGHLYRLKRLTSSSGPIVTTLRTITSLAFMPGSFQRLKWA